MRDIWAHGVGKALIYKRAWVVQERFLARRNLHFGRVSSVGDHELEACETFPGELSPAIFDPYMTSGFKGSHLSADQISNEGKMDKFFKDWSKIIHICLPSLSFNLWKRQRNRLIQSCTRFFKPYTMILMGEDFSGSASLGRRE